MPKVMESTVASSLGLPGEFDSTSDLVQAYVDDFVHDPLLTLSSSSTYSTDASTSPVTPLTVGFIGVGHMGSGKKKKKKKKFLFLLLFVNIVFFQYVTATNMSLFLFFYVHLHQECYVI